MKKLVVDSYALLCLFDGKRAGERDFIMSRLAEAEKGQLELLLCKVNEGEIYYRLFRFAGESVAVAFRRDLKKGRVPVRVVSVNDRRVESASELKARYAISYADAFCAELALAEGAPILSGDPEFADLAGLVKAEWVGGMTAASG